METDEVRRKLERFIGHEARDSTPLYAALASRMLGDDDFLELLSYAPDSQPMPHLFLAVAQYLLAQNSGPIWSGDDHDRAFERLQTLVRDHGDEVLRLLTTRIVQANEVRRSIFLYLCYVRICREFPEREFALVEIGASAGLNLLFDQYRYQFEDEPPFGDLDSNLHVSSRRVGDLRPKTDRPANQIIKRIGLDLNPIDVHSPDDVAWLTALIWPEHLERFELLREAIAIRRGADVTMIQGDGIALLPPVLDDIPTETVPLVFHTHVANQMSPEARQILRDTIDRVGARRDVVHLHNNLEAHVHADIYRDGIHVGLPLCNADGHARWVEWLDAS